VPVAPVLLGPILEELAPFCPLMPRAATWPRRAPKREERSKEEGAVDTSGSTNLAGCSFMNGTYPRASRTAHTKVFNLVE
jgi:hypothetical protein